jgi:hypothetical protein
MSEPGHRYMLDLPDEWFCVPGGTLLYHSKRDARLPCLYIVPSHPLVDRSCALPTSKGRTIVYIQDTSESAMQKQNEFEETLVVPLGPDATMINSGMRY